MNLLIEQITKANISYYKGNPIITDLEYDLLLDKLEKESPNHPLLTKVGNLSSINTGTELPVWMGSLDKMKDHPSKNNGLNNYLKIKNDICIISEKLDGISLLLKFKDKEWSCYTRGNGHIGLDISNNIIPYLNLDNINKTLLTDGLLIRGELILPKITNKLISTNKNLRSIVNGVAMAKNPNIDILKYIHFVAYGLPNKMITPIEQFDYLEKLNFRIPKHNIISTKKFINAITFYDYLTDTLINYRKNSDYIIDGIVISYNIVETQIVGKNPKYSIAFKTTKDSTIKLTTITDIIWNISKDKLLKPVIIISPIDIDGVTINRVTGNNAKYIKDKCLGVGSKILVIRSGDVIPKIHNIISTDITKISYPPKHIKYNWCKNNIDYIATNINNDGILLLHFINSINIKYINEGLVKRLIDSGINTPEKLICATQDSFKNLPNFAEKSSQKIYNSIQNAFNNCEFIDIMVGSNCYGRGLSKKRLQLIINNIGLSKIIEYILLNKTSNILQKIDEIKGFGNILKTQFIEGSVRFNEFLENSPKIESYCLKKFKESNKNKNKVSHKHNIGKLSNVNIVLTGFRDDSLVTSITNIGGNIQSNITKKTNLLIKPTNSNNLSGKEKQANKLNISIYTKDEFINKFL